MHAPRMVKKSETPADTVSAPLGQGQSVCIVLARADADMTQAPTIDYPTHSGHHPSASNGLKLIALGSRKLASWINLASASTTAISLANALPRVLMCFLVRNNLRPGGHCFLAQRAAHYSHHEFAFLTAPTSGSVALGAIG